MLTVIENGLVVDPANKILSKQNVVIRDRKIVEVTAKTVENCVRIDATNKIVCPGFIDIHMHEDNLDEASGRLETTMAANMLRMGVTTAVGGNCGSNSYAPDKYFALLDRDKCMINLALLAGHGDLREIAGQTDRYRQIDGKMKKKMVALAEKWLELGCIGISFGVRYFPGSAYDEMDALFAVCAQKNKMVASHIRDDAEQVFSAAEEFLSMARKNNASAQFSHIGSMGGFGQMEELLAMVDGYKLNGLDVSCDCYPYYAFSTMVGEPTYDDGFLERYDMDYQQIEICNGEYKGKRCNKEMFDYLRKNAPGTITVSHVMKQEDVDMALLHPNVFVASDGFMDHGQGHPRAAGTFPRYIKNFVKANKISLYDAIAKMTFHPAEKLGFANKGRFSKNADADIMIFDLDKIKDNATFDNPSSPPDGIDYVMVNGEIALAGGKVVNDKLGRAIKK